MLLQPREEALETTSNATTGGVNSNYSPQWPSKGMNANPTKI
jgi:hypothetical protein